MAPKHEIVHHDQQCSFAFKTHPYPYPCCVWHHHPEIEIHLIHHAKGQCVVGDYFGAFEHGHLVLTGPNLPHNWHSVEFNQPGMEPQKDFVIQVHPDLITETLGRLPEARDIRNLIDSSERGFEFHGPKRAEAEHLIVAMEHADSFHRVTLLWQLLHVLATCEDRSKLASPNFGPQSEPSNCTRVEAIQAVIRRNYHLPLGQSEMAKSFNMTPETFSRFFTRHFGQSFVRYVNSVRVGEACNLLMEEGRTIAEIAFAVGFNNISNFNRRFIEMKGITPREYRIRSKARLGTPVTASQPVNGVHVDLVQ